MKLIHCLKLHTIPSFLPNGALLLLGGMLPGVGCRPQEEIATYQVAKTAPRPVVDVDRLAGQFDHLLAAVVPQGNKAWFFKLVGPLASIDRHRDEFLQLLGSLKLNTGKNPDWQVPDGWQEKPASGMRAATFAIDDPSGPLELTVTSLPVNGVWDDYMANNVNRWLNQLQQAPLETDEIRALLKTVSIDKHSSDAFQEGKPPAAVAIWMELVGIMPSKSESGRMPPGHPPIASGSQSVEPPTAGDPPQTQTASPLTYLKPAGWQPGRAGGMRKAAFQIVAGDKRAEMTVIDLPIRGASGIADVTANVRRWAAQVGLQDFSDKQLAELTHPVEIDGTTGHHTTLLGPGSKSTKTNDAEMGSKGLLAAMIERDGKVWFFKLTGDRSLVENQQQSFADFLKSVKFK